jgi:hypothetical protein
MADSIARGSSKGLTAPSDWHSTEATISLASGILSYLGMTKQGSRESVLCGNEEVSFRRP